MKKTKIFFLAASLSLFGIGAQAQTPVTIYTGSSLPVEQGWTELKLDSSVNPAAAITQAASENGLLKFSSVNGLDTFSQLGWYQAGVGLDLNKGYTVELKAKLNVATKGSFNIQGYDNSGRGFRVSIADTFLTNQSDPLDATTLIAGGLTSDADFHVYRLAVTAAGQANVYRDGEKIGTFSLGAFQFDNIITNGGFEDEEFPDFLTNNGSLERFSEGAFAGQFALLMDNNGKTSQTTPKEGATTREFPLKPNTDYEFSLTRRRAIPDNEWAWRDLGMYWNTQEGTVREGTPTANNGPNEKWWNNPFETLTWTTGTETINKGDDADKTTLRFEFPSWTRDDVKNISKVLIDNVVFREKLNLATGVKTGFPDPLFPEGYVNIIKNGGFEDHTIDNEGNSYTWELSTEGVNDGNTPYGSAPLWNTGKVRIQRSSQDNDFDDNDRNYAHSGTSSLRFTTDWNATDKRDDKNFDFTVELEADKTYRFNFWHRSPRWPDQGNLKVRVGDGDPIWGHRLSGDYNFWANADLVFTTTESNHTLHLYSDDHGDWFNIYLDDLVLYEVTGSGAGALDPQIAGKTNLIDNGDFENDTIDNEGNKYVWALASGNANGAGDNYPVAYSELWKGHVRLQDQQKGNDTGLEWAHSGTKSLRVSYLAEDGPAKTFENITDNREPEAWKVNINFEKELAIGKTYTFVFWLKTADYGDRGTLKLANGEAVIWQQELSRKYVNWTRNSITFTTNAADHTLRMFTEFSGWFNFYLDDLFLFEDDASNADNSYIFFGKSQNTASADVEVEYVSLITEGAYDPDGNVVIPIFTITYNENGGDELPDSSFTTGNEAIVLPAASRAGYTFAGWYANATLTGSPVTEVAANSVSHKAFWAKWEAIAYAITYNKEAKFTTILNGTYTIEDAVTLPTVLGYTIEWYDNSDLTGAPVTEIPVGSIGDKEFWLRSEPIAYAITYYFAAVSEPLTYTIESAAITLPVPTKADSTFVGWWNNNRFSGSAVTEIPAGSNGNKDFWAKWEKSPDAPSAVSSLSASALHIYPNPVVNGVLNIGNLSGSSKVEIYNVIGALVGVYNVTGTHAAVSISALPSGTYIVKINNQTATIIKE
ncbi:MAG: InlB B-repeat-containing protein [Prevotellaceae bacterium]|jgi:uncharacterized repeat protein (TIGR02543 family)|nr:InlB B-repeat-containing protein [Prevotellaceae bacterium]